jgi:hypothetical protein
MAIALFFAGEKIEKNLDAWVRLFERFSRAKDKAVAEGPISVDPDGALAMAVIAAKETLGELGAVELKAVVLSNDLGGGVTAYTDFDRLKLDLLREEEGEHRLAEFFAKNDFCESSYTFFLQANGKNLTVLVSNSGDAEVVRVIDIIFEIY